MSARHWCGWPHYYGCARCQDSDDEPPPKPPEPCQWCEGTGIDATEDGVDCTECDGTGVVQQ